MMGLHESLARWRRPVALGMFLLALASPAQVRSSDFPTTLSDPAFARYVNLDSLAIAWQEKNAEKLTDLGLQLAEGERVLLRSHKAISADQVLALAAKIAAERKDKVALARLAKVVQGKNNELTAQIALAQKLASVSRAPDPGMIVQLDQISPATFLIFQATLEEITAAKIAEKASDLDNIARRIPDMKKLSDAQRRTLLKAVNEARAAMPNDAKDINPAVSVLNKLSMESRNPPARRPSHSNPPVHRPPVHRPPVYRPNNPPHVVHQPTHTNPPPVYRPHNPPPTHQTFNPPVVHRPPPVVSHNNNAYRPSNTQTRPFIFNNKGKTNITVINNVTNITCVNTNQGFVIGGNAQCGFTSSCTLDPGDVIVSVGGVDCGNSNLSLQELIEQAYQNGNLVVLIRDVNTGDTDTYQLDPPGNGDGDGDGDGNGGGGALNVVDTTWVGSENLGNYGRLEFRFQDNGQATMIDTDGTTNGSYSADGNNVTLYFHNNTVVYRGTFNGSAIAGTGTNGQATWNFSVSR